MSDTEVTPTTIIDPPKGSLRDRLLDQALHERQLEIWQAEAAASRAALEAEALADRKANGTRGWDLFDGDTTDRAALVAIKTSNEKVAVTNEAEYTDFVMAHLPAGSVEMVTRVLPSVQKAMFKSPIVEDGQVMWADPATGELIPVPGVKHDPGGTPTGISFTQRKTDVLDRMLAGNHPALTVPSTAIEDGAA